MASGLVWHLVAFFPFVWWGWRYFVVQSRIKEIEEAVLRLVAWPESGPLPPVSLVKRAFGFLEGELRQRFANSRVQTPSVDQAPLAARSLWCLLNSSEGFLKDAEWVFEEGKWVAK